ncbi:MAG: M23 family metallopeptidase, partial [Moorea sp. SIO3I7]|nr:M23 family metallopeptidase [Moorena sp. SIO3I7]NEO01133.1 M23 family metallopeptidase [Moorena sp. SIO3I7]NEQ63483.1 M23 family metallopeptidase [Moorena sp. SIO4A1]
QGQRIAAMGSTGYSTGPHLHFELHPRGRGAANPMAYLPRRR